jgi:hypothetical protein
MLGIVKKGDLITFTDEQTILDLMDEGHAQSMRGRDLTVKKVNKYSCVGIRWILIEFEQDCNLSLLIKECAGEKDIRAMFVPDDFQAGDRADLMEADCQWLFQEPETEDWVLSDLEMADPITNDLDGETMEFVQKNGTFYGEDSEGNFAAITEWFCSSPNCPNPELILFEVGDPEDESGGFITCYQGINLMESDIEHFST